ncbi:hypothetical protein HMPREF9549_02317, partial [Escherichia coli MS 185-1]
GGGGGGGGGEEEGKGNRPAKCALFMPDATLTRLIWPTKG